MKQRFVALLAVIMMAMPVAAFAEVNDNEVISAKIKEATAGSTNQDTNSGYGVKTGHIVDTAVTTAKIKDGAVTGAKISDGAVTGTKISDGAVTDAKILDGAVTGLKISDGAVTGTKVADGSITDAKISGTISSSKLNVGTTAGTVAAGDHSHDNLGSVKIPANMRVVQMTDTDGVRVFSDIQSAIDSITDASPANPYVIKVMPGIYNVGTGVITMKANVDIEGSGENATVIAGEGTKGNSGSYWSCIVIGAPDSEIRALKIRPNGGYRVDSFAAVFYGNSSSSTFRLSNVTIDSQTSISNHAGIIVYAQPGSIASAAISKVTLTGVAGYSYGVYTDNAKINMDGISMSGNLDYGIVSMDNGDITITNSTINNYGSISINNHGKLQASNITLINAGPYQNAAIKNFRPGVATIDRSTLSSTVDAVYNDSQLKIGSSKLQGTFTLYAPITCVGNYDQNYAPVTCP